MGHNYDVGSIGFNANNYSSTYQDNAKVQPDNGVCLYIIKY